MHVLRCRPSVIFLSFVSYYICNISMSCLTDYQTKQSFVLAHLAKTVAQSATEANIFY